MRLIDADALKEVICNNVYPVTDYFNSRDYGMFWTGGIEKAIDEMPTIDAEPVKHGKWKIKTINTFDLAYGTTGYEPVYQCSVCGGMMESYLRLDEPIMPEDADFPRYCPRCGARMDEDEISNIAKESAYKISKALDKVREKGMQKQNIKEDDEP